VLSWVFLAQEPCKKRRKKLKDKKIKLSTKEITEEKRRKGDVVIKHLNIPPCFQRTPVLMTTSPFIVLLSCFKDALGSFKNFPWQINVFQLLS
jgi:hypothetical protein